MKKFLLILVLAFLLTACTAAQSTLVALPEEGSVLVFTLITAGVAWVLLQLSGLLKIDLGGYVDPIVAIIAPVIVTLIENGLKTIPPIYDNIVLTLIHLLVLLVGSVGVLLMAKQKKFRNLLR